jgi:hypothetical protein
MENKKIQNELPVRITLRTIVYFPQFVSQPNNLEYKKKNENNIEFLLLLCLVWEKLKENERDTQTSEVMQIIEDEQQKC